MVSFIPLKIIRQVISMAKRSAKAKKSKSMSHKGMDGKAHKGRKNVCEFC